MLQEQQISLSLFLLFLFIINVRFFRPFILRDFREPLFFWSLRAFIFIYRMSMDSDSEFKLVSEIMAAVLSPLNDQ